MRQHYTPRTRTRPYADAALAIVIGFTLAYLLFVYL